MEAFLTSVVSLSPRLIEGKARILDLKSIRHIGHCERMHALLDLGFGSSEPISVGSNVRTSSEFLLELPKKRRMVETGKEVVLCKIEVRGVQQRREQLSGFKIIDFFNENDNITGTMRMSAYPSSVVAQLLAGNRIAACGVVPPEICIPLEELLGALPERGIKIEGYTVKVQ